jgi:serine/threonine-protein kinase
MVGQGTQWPESSGFGALLKQYRVAAGLTQEGLAELAGVSVRGISDLERGVALRPQRETLHALMDALQLAPHDRAIFERAAQRDTAPPVNPGRNRPLSTGGFLGAIPRGDLIARDEEMIQIEAVLEAAAQGAGACVLLSGEAGIGKTRLAQDTMTRAWHRDYLVGTGRCYQQEHREAYRPVLEALAECVDSAPPEQRAGIERDWRSMQAYIDASTRGGADEAIRLSAAVVEFARRIAASSPVTLLVDDIHWADEYTLTLLHALARVARGAPLVLVATFRDLRLSEDHPALARTLRDLSRERLVERITIRRLSAEQTATLAASMMGEQPLSEEMAAFIYRRTKGIPRLVDQLMRSLGGRLQLQEEIGAGSTGRVFRAYDTRTNQTVAVKLIVGRGELDLDALLRFEHEAEVLTTLEHPNIVRIDDSFAEEHVCCIIMELLDGRSLREILRDGPLPLGRVRDLALQVADALAYAHSRSIVHRDIKPDNVMVLADDRVKVTDFGIARVLQRDMSLQTFATTGLRIGSPVYMAPEQVEGKKIGGWTDIYALGAVMYHMVTGRPPFQGDDPLAVALKQVQEQPTPPSALDRAIPKSWDAVILTALAKEPGGRYQSAQAMRAAIEALSVEPESMPATKGTVDGGVRSRLTRMRYLLPVVGGLIVAVVVLAAVLRDHSSGAQASPRTPACVPVYVKALRDAQAESGFARASSRLGVTKPLVYDLSNATDEYVAVSRIAQRNPCVAVMFGFADLAFLTHLSARYPGVHFAVIDNAPYNNNGPVTLTNVEGWTFRTEQSGYLVGYLAGLMEREKVRRAVHGVIGVMGGVQIPAVDSFIHGYQQGAHAAYPSIRILTDYANTFVDTGRTRAIGLSQVARGADILFGVAGTASLGYLGAAKERGVYAIGVDEGQGYLGSFVLTSALKRFGTGVYDAVMQSAHHHFTDGVRQLGLTDGGVGIASPSRVVPASIVAAVRAQEQKVVRGEVQVQP